MVIELLDYAQLQGLSLGVGQVAQSIGQLRCMSVCVNLRLQARELVRVVVKLDAEPAADLKLRPAAATATTHEVSSDPVRLARVASLIPRDTQPPEGLYPMWMMLATEGIPAASRRKSMYAPGGAMLLLGGRVTVSWVTLVALISSAT